jgi:glutamyl-Q tRNA(Asp) synthetase
MYQSSRLPAYEAALEQLRANGQVYACACSRKEIGDSGSGGAIYPGTCREGLVPGRTARAWRVRTQPGAIAFEDLLQGRVSQHLERETGDFVVQRADRVVAYHLACAVDDSAQGITHIVRGADLIASTPRQIFLQRLLALPTPQYLHLPVALNEAGEKLSKQTRARAVDGKNTAVLALVLKFLGHEPPDDVCADDLSAQWQWAIVNWRRSRIPAVAAAPGPQV